MKAASTGRIERLLAGRIGLDPASVGDNLIANGVRARMEALGLAGREEYERALLGPGDELQALVEEIVIPESWFFRDDRPFEALREHAKAGWSADPARPPLAALSLPCAGGEEPYSIAIAMAEAGLGPGRFRVDAADVSERALARAIAGVYGPNSFRGASAAIRPRFFRELGGRYAIDPEIRRSVRFRVGNLLDAGLFEGLPPFDVVFCRNLLIYLDPPARARAFATLARLTVDGGLLFLGHADRPDESAASPFRPLAARGSFAHRKGSAGSGRPDEGGPGRGAATRPDGPGPRPSATRAAGARSSPSSQQAGAEILPPSPVAGEGRDGGGSSRRRADPGPPVAVPPPAESPAAALERASSLADRGLYEEATALVGRAIARGGPSARGSFLLGMIRQAAGDLEGAEGHFQRAVYLDAGHDEALLALAILAGRRGDRAAEAGFRRRAGRVLSRKAGGA